MALQELDNSNINIHLGKSSEYKSQYDPSLLVREPRQSNRTHLGITEENLPFVGFDTWNGYEISGLTDNGLPVTGVVKLVYPCDSKYIVESKSIKLYFNSTINLLSQG
jgi:7-cyano-7-deazaguanine reductase